MIASRSPWFSVAAVVAMGSLPLPAQAGKEPAMSFTAMQAQLEELGQMPEATRHYPAPAIDAAPELRPIFFDGPDWQGRETRVFAWLGLPPAGASPAPAIVLVHGGGGTAFRDWVKKWTEHGFAALALAVEGQTDERPAGERHQSEPWRRHAHGGPPRPGIYGDATEPFTDQWMFQAVAATIRARHLLAALPAVDASRIGLMGISWGGVIVSTVIGLDVGFAFAIPTYGCGGLHLAPNQYGRALGDHALYQQVWDPDLRLDRAQLPVLWLSWPEDAHFPMDCLAATRQRTAGPTMLSLIPGMGHSHAAAWQRPESYAFAVSIVQGGRPWGREEFLTLEDGLARAVFTSDLPLDRAYLVATADHGITGARTWSQLPASLTRSGEKWVATATLPADTTAWFINVVAGNLVVSSTYQVEEQ
jgi:dienelactone hydrolase